jgi:hypothetical protein
METAQNNVNNDVKDQEVEENSESSYAQLYYDMVGYP